VVDAERIEGNSDESSGEEKDSESDEGERMEVVEDSEEEAPPLIERRPPSKRVPSTTLRDTFISLISEIKLKSDLGRCTFEEGVRLVVQCLAGKGFVRSDSEETNARKTLKMVKNSTSQEEKKKLMNDLCDRLINLDFSYQSLIIIQ